MSNDFFTMCKVETKEAELTLSSSPSALHAGSSSKISETVASTALIISNLAFTLKIERTAENQ